MFFEADGAIVSGGLRCSDQNDFAFGPDVGLGLFDELFSDSLFLVAFIDGKVGKVLFYNNGFRRDTKVESGNPDIVARIFENYGRNSLIKRLQANRCEWCGAENVPLEIHHIRKLKDLSGRKQWEIAMIGRKRKTMALCVYCHDKLHAGKLD